MKTRKPRDPYQTVANGLNRARPVAESLLYKLWAIETNARKLQAQGHAVTIDADLKAVFVKLQDNINRVQSLLSGGQTNA